MKGDLDDKVYICAGGVVSSIGKGILLRHWDAYLKTVAFQ